MADKRSDVLLLELVYFPPRDYYTYYAGWDATGAAPNATVGIHHPDGDIKKISIDNDPATSGRWSDGYYTSPSGSHWEVEFDVGTVEEGSSGSPLFDESSHRIVGQLTGSPGGDPCIYTEAKYGKFSRSWSYGLKNYLDPDNTGIQQLAGAIGPRSLSVNVYGPCCGFSEGQPVTFTANVSGGDPPYDWVLWSKNIGELMGWVPISSCNNTTSCTTSFQDPDHETDPGRVKLEVRDDGQRWFGSGQDEVVIYDFGGSYALSSSGAGSSIPEEFALQGNAPNPFKEQTLIRFALPEAAQVELVIYDAMGREVQRLIDRKMEAGYKQVLFDASNLASGMYIYRLWAGDFMETKRMIVVR